MARRNREGFRGYICARMAMGRSVPQHIQQLVMRDYAAKRNLPYLLAAVEYRMPGCTMMLDAVLNDLDHLQGVIMYSLYLLPRARAKRLELYRRVLDKGCTLHMAAEVLSIGSWEDANRIEDVWQVADAISGQQASDLEYLKTWDRNAAA